ncbi:uncharacterized protein I206_107469 [Kwoniella pini CBS 10737]|uniref:Protein YOP1 n=1 Tax=Kwoniella pini CBS 10737 TaxID=1296096 RepID=A0A1B9HXD4_9TREE|nr:uncharacterized protein I206_05798 [Kwoniella pini CBS 10737]OCF47933.1 hypothetical protein I206_05798 [Kwoniella pini CBS 10737]
MLIALLSRWSCHVCSYLYPAYASYKALSLHPDSSPEAMAQVERWLMYWSVVGTWTAIESVLGWTFTWLPFYSLIKTLIFLYLSLPQSEGSTYIYTNHLAPLFQEHESDIDAFLSSLRYRASAALAGGLGWCWEKIKAQLNIALPAGAEPFPGQGGYDTGNVQGFDVSGMHQPPTLQDPASGAIQQVYGLFTRYAGQYMPVALSTLAAAASASQSSISRGPSRAEQIPESMSMPIPIPTPSVKSSTSDQTIRSRTYLNALGSSGNYPNITSPELSQAASSARFNGNRSISTTRPNIINSSNTSEESLGYLVNNHEHENKINSRSSSDMSGYEQINREEAQGAPSSQNRPNMEQRRSSGWFGWGAGTGTPEKPKTQ